jgi:hypothetical protein
MILVFFSGLGAGDGIAIGALYVLILSFHRFHAGCIHDVVSEYYYIPLNSSQQPKPFDYITSYKGEFEQVWS